MKRILAYSLGILLIAACQPVTYDTFGTISGTVLDFETGTPIQNSVITLNPTGKNAFTGSDGFFQFDDLDPTRYTVTAQKEGYDSDFLSITVYAGQVEMVSIALRKK